MSHRVAAVRCGVILWRFVARLNGSSPQVVDVLHPDKPNVAVEDLKKELADRYRGKETCVFIFGLKTQFGGGKSTGFGLIYDNEAQAKKTEPKYRLLRVSAVLHFRLPFLLVAGGRRPLAAALNVARI